MHAMMKKCSVPLVLLTIALLGGDCSRPGHNGKLEEGPYVWKNVRISGGGFVTGIVFHPAEPGLRYCRTDMGGAYRWNNSEQMWEPLLDWISYEDRNLMGVESIALDPSDPDMLYLACGTYTNPQAPVGAILWSADRGETFHRTDLPFKLGANENGRGNGERMAADPLAGNILYLGTRHDGLWRSEDGALNWTRVESFPDITETIPEETGRRNRWSRMQNMGCGIVFVVFDPGGRAARKAGNAAPVSKSRSCQVIYVGASLMGRHNLYRSADGGVTWKAVPGQPVDYRPTHAVLSPDGMLYISYGTNPGPLPMRNGAVWKLDTRTDEWTDITPDRPDPENGRAFGYAAVSVDAENPDVLIASSYNRYSAGGEELFRSLDGGRSWKAILRSGSEFDYSKAPYIRHTGVHWMFDVEIDPFDGDHALITTGYGGHETFNLSAADRGKPVLWQIMSGGIEETVPLDLLSPPSGAQLITGVGDYCGFLHRDLDRPVPEGCFVFPHFGNTNSLACAELIPAIVLRSGVEAGRNPVHNFAWSLDGGMTWHSTRSMPFPEARHGFAAASANGATWIWTPQQSGAWVTADRGDSWSPVRILPVNTRVIADPVDPTIFYAMDLFGGKFFISRDRGCTFDSLRLELPGGIPAERSGRGDSRGGQDRIYATPGKTGDIWLAAFHGLFHSENYGENFIRMPSVSEIHAFGFGAPAPRGNPPAQGGNSTASGSNPPALYLVGTVGGLRGIFRSDDFGQSWLRINDDRHQWGLILQITGDPKKYGRVYVGTHGRGAVYGDPRGDDSSQRLGSGRPGGGKHTGDSLKLAFNGYFCRNEITAA